jgi:hypothetical protein
VPYNPDEYNAFLNELDKIGSVGIWKNYFDANQFKIIETILKDRGINLNNFKLE